MSCKTLNLEDLSPKKGTSCKKGFSGMYNRCYVSAEELAELLASGDAEVIENYKGEMQIVITKQRNESKTLQEATEGGRQV